MKRYPAMLSKLYNTPHCILPAKLQEIAAFLESRVAGVEVDGVVVEQPQGYCVSPGGEQIALDKLSAVGAGDSFIAVLPLFGTMFQHGGIEMEISGGTSTEQFGRQFSALDANPSVKTIIIETHSGGGQVWGTEELSDLIFAARERGATRIVTVANSMIASAAVWASTAAHQVFITPGGEMGSVGVVMIHVDQSEADKMAGLKYTLIATPAKKVAGNDFEPLDNETAAEWLASCDRTLVKFVGALSRNRGVSEEHVRTKFGGGAMLDAPDVVKAKLADGVATMRDVLMGEMEKLRAVGRGNAKANARALKRRQRGLTSGGVLGLMHASNHPAHLVGQAETRSIE